MEFQISKSVGKILRNKYPICNKKSLHSGVNRVTSLHSGVNRVTSAEYRERYVRKPQEILTYLVNMCKYFVTTIIIKVHHLLELQISVDTLKNKIKLDATYYFIMLMLGSTFFGHHYAHHQELTTTALVTT